MILKLLKSHSLCSELLTKQYLSPQEPLPSKTANIILAVNKDNVYLLNHNMYAFTLLLCLNYKKIFIMNRLVLIYLTDVCHT